MSDTSTPVPAAAPTRQRKVTTERFAVRAIEAMVPQLEAGRLNILLPNGGTIVRHGAMAGPEASVRVHRWRAIFRILFAGDPGFSDGFIAGEWTTPDLTTLLQLLDRNAAPLAQASRNSAFGLLRDRLLHRRNANTRRGSRRNIAAHYDLGNEFYRLWLDDGMNYSSALYSGQQSLEQAQFAKLSRVAQLMDLSGGENVLEIGCGWGALAEHLVRRHRSRVVGLTLSTEQLRFSQQRLGDDAQFHLEDYRDSTGNFDRIVSIEMLEAVGERYWSAYFDVLKARLAADGVAVLQVITIDEARYDAYRRHPDFIQRHIFPGGMLPTRRAIECEAARAGLGVTSWTAFGESYARTLAEWRNRFDRAENDLKAQGFDRLFQRMWHYYLCYCEAGFRSGAIDVNLIRLAPL